MKCTISDCNAQHRTFIRLPGQDKPKPFCGPHTLEMRSRFSQSTPESETLAPVIDINTRERIASWAQRYANNNPENSNQQQPAAQNSIGSHLTELYNMIWPEGPKTMASDVSNISKMTIDPQKRDNAKAVVQSIIPYIKQKGKELKNKFQGRDENGLDEDGLIKPIASKYWNERYATEHKRHFIDPIKLTPPQHLGNILSLPSEAYPKVKPELLPAWNVVSGKLSSSITPDRERAEVAPNSKGNPLHTVRSVFNKMFRSGMTQSQMDGGNMSELYDVDRVKQNLKDTIVPAENNPEHMVTVYRAVPRHVDTIHHGDQVTTDPVRALHVAARTDGLSSELPAQGKKTHILTTQVPAKHLISSVGTGITPEGYDSNNITRWTDYGYFPNSSEEGK